MHPILLAFQPAVPPPEGEIRSPATAVAGKNPGFAGMVEEAWRRQAKPKEPEPKSEPPHERDEPKSLLLEKKGEEERLASAGQACPNQPAQAMESPPSGEVTLPDAHGQASGNPAQGQSAEAARPHAAEAKTVEGKMLPKAESQPAGNAVDPKASPGLGAKGLPVSDLAVEAAQADTGAGTSLTISAEQLIQGDALAPAGTEQRPLASVLASGKAYAAVVTPEAMAHKPAEALAEGLKPPVQPPAQPPAAQSGQVQVSAPTAQTGWDSTGQPQQPPSQSGADAVANPVSGLQHTVQQSQGLSVFEPARLSEVRSPEFLNQIRVALQGMRRIGENTLKLSLAPEELGQIELRIVNRQDGLGLTILAERGTTVGLLEKYLGELRRDLQQSGLTLTDVFIGQRDSQHNQQNAQAALATQLRRRPVGAPVEAVVDEPSTARAYHWTEEGALDVRI